MCEFIDIHTHRIRNGLSIYDMPLLSCTKDSLLCSAGIHPMHIQADSFSKLKGTILSQHVTAIGEVGLDRLSPTDMRQQTNLFEDIVHLSEEVRKPLIIHCVRAFPELLHIRKESRAKQPWIIHGYNNNQQILNKLIEFNFFISAGVQLFNSTSNIRTLLPTIPPNRLFLETDDAACPIEEVYREAAKILKMDMEALKKQIYLNFKQIFRDDS